MWIVSTYLKNHFFTSIHRFCPSLKLHSFISYSLLEVLSPKIFYDLYLKETKNLKFIDKFISGTRVNHVGEIIGSYLLVPRDRHFPSYKITFTHNIPWMREIVTMPVVPYCSDCSIEISSFRNTKLKIDMHLKWVLE